MRHAAVGTSIAVASVAALALALYETNPLKAQEAAQGEVVVCFLNDTGGPIILGVNGHRGCGNFRVPKDKVIEINFYDDGHERVISAFAPGSKKAITHFTMIPGNFCVIIEKNMTEMKKTTEAKKPEGDPSNVPL